MAADAAVTYLAVKTLHVVGGTVLLGTGLGIAFFSWFGYRQALRKDSIELLRGILTLTVVADTVFTASAAVLQPITGAALWRMTINDWGHPWLWLVVALYLGVGACWLPVVFLQIRLRRIASAADSIATLPSTFHKSFRIWFALGIPALVMMIALVVAMVFRYQWL
jgi:uncharacterized membrane protein